MCRTDMIQTFVGNQCDHLNMKCSSRALLLTVEASEPCLPTPRDAPNGAFQHSSLFSPWGSGSCRLPFCPVPGPRGRPQRPAGALKTHQLRPRLVWGPPSRRGSMPQMGATTDGPLGITPSRRSRSVRRLSPRPLLKHYLWARAGPARRHSPHPGGPRPPVHQNRSPGVPWRRGGPRQPP